MKRTKSTYLALIGFFALFGMQAASATPIISRVTGIASPTNTIDFSEIVLADDTVMSNQYVSEGVSTFSGLWYNGCPVCVTTPPDGVKPDLTNFFASQSSGGGADFSMTFANLVADAAFGFASNLGQHTFTALLGAITVETFTVITNNTTCDNTSGWCYYGFENTTGFDRITVTMNGIEGIIDNLQFTTTSVPEPGTLALLGIGLFGMGLARRRKKV